MQDFIENTPSSKFKLDKERLLSSQRYHNECAFLEQNLTATIVSEQEHRLRVPSLGCSFSYELRRNTEKDAFCTRKIRPVQGSNSQCPAPQTNALTIESKNRFSDVVVKG